MRKLLELYNFLVIENQPKSIKQKANLNDAETQKFRNRDFRDV